MCRSRALPWLYLLVLLVFTSVFAPVLPAPVSIGVVLVVGALLFFRVSRALCSDPRLAWIVCSSYVLRAAIAILLFVASGSHLPLFFSLQRGNGFWEFAPDAEWYHGHALNLLHQAVSTGWIRGFADVDETVNLFGGLVALSYWWFLPHPLIPITFNIWAATGTAVFAFEISRHLAGSVRTGLISALFVGFWPSTLLWSAQLLREPLLLFLLFLTFSLVLQLFSESRLPARLIVLILGMIYLATFFLAKSRYYSAWLLLASFGAVGLVSFALFGWRQRLICAGCSIAIGLGVAVGVTQPVSLPLPTVLLFGASPTPAQRPLEEKLPSSDRPLTPLGEEGHSPTPAQRPLEEKLPSSDRPLTPLGDEGHSPLVILNSIRKASVQSGGNSLNPDADISTVKGFFRQLPASIAAVILTPYPWRAHPMGSTGVFRTVAALESIIVVFLLPALLIGSVAIIRRLSVVGSFMILYGVVISCLIAVVVANEGTLFRLRLQGLFPVLVAAIAGGGLGSYSRVLRRVRFQKRKSV